MGRQYVEYEFTLPDGTTRYEIVDMWSCAPSPLKQVGMFTRMHGAVSAAPVE